MEPKLIKRGESFFVDVDFEKALAGTGIVSMDAVFSFSQGKDLAKDNLAAHRRRIEFELNSPNVTVFLKRYDRTPFGIQFRNWLSHGFRRMSMSDSDVKPVGELDRHLGDCATSSLDHDLQRDLVADWIEAGLFGFVQRFPSQTEEACHRIARAGQRFREPRRAERVDLAKQTPIVHRLAARRVTRADAELGATRRNRLDHCRQGFRRMREIGVHAQQDVVAGLAKTAKDGGRKPALFGANDEPNGKLCGQFLNNGFRIISADVIHDDHLAGDVRGMQCGEDSLHKDRDVLGFSIGGNDDGDRLGGHCGALYSLALHFVRQHGIAVAQSGTGAKQGHLRSPDLPLDYPAIVLKARVAARCLERFTKGAAA